MKYNNYTLSYDKYIAIATGFYDEVNKELITGLDIFLKFDYEFINTKLTDEELNDFTIPTPEIVYVKEIGEIRLYELVTLVFDRDKRDIFLKCHPFVEGKVHIRQYTKYIPSAYYEISEEEFKRLLFDNYEKFETKYQQTTSLMITILD